MPKSVPASQLDRVVFEVAKHHAGIGVDALHQALGGKPSRRTLQRRLAMLVQARRLVRQGEGRALRYRRVPSIDSASIPGRANPPQDDWDWWSGPADDTAMLAEQSDVRPTAEIYVPVSAAGEEIKGHVRRPPQQRRPVAYNMAPLVLLCHKRSHAFMRMQHGHRGSFVSKAAAIRSRKLVMDDGTWRCVRWAATRLVVRG